MRNLDLETSRVLDSVSRNKYIRFEISKWSYWDYEYKKNTATFFKLVSDRAYDICKNLKNTFDILKIDIFLYNRNKKVRNLKEKKMINEICNVLKIKKPDEIVYSKVEYDLIKVRLMWDLLYMDIDLYNIIYEISKTDFGGCKELMSYTCLIDTFNNIVFNFYDDRGLDIISDKENILYHFYKKYNSYILDYNRNEIDKIFKDFNNENIFEIYIHDLHWIEYPGNDKYADNEYDLCLHGIITVRIDCEVFTYDACVSVSAYRMLKTLKYNHVAEHRCEQIIPCCGDILCLDENNDDLIILGCESGIDYDVYHRDGNIYISTEYDTYKIPYCEYKNEVLNFAKKVKDFYRSCMPKLYSNDRDKILYEKFWEKFNLLMEI